VLKQSMSEPDLRSIDDLPLSGRTTNALKRAGLTTIADVMLRDESQLSAVYGLGEGGLRELAAVLEQQGLALPPVGRAGPQEAAPWVADPPSDPSAEERKQTTGAPRSRAGTSLVYVGLSRRTYHCLRRDGMATLEDVAARDRLALLSIPDFGEKGLAEIQAALRRHGLKLQTASGLAGRGSCGPGAINGGPIPIPHSASRWGQDAEAADQPPRSDRAAEMYSLLEHGHSVADVAARFGVSRQRVHQLVAASGGDVGVARRAGAARQHSEALALAGPILERYRDGEEPREIGHALGIAASSVQDVIRREATPDDRVRRRASKAARLPSQRRYSDAQLTDAVAEVAEHLGGRTPTSNEYAEYAQERGLPSLPTVANRFGGWNGATERAGLESKSKRPYKRKWTEEACWLALRRLADELGEVPSVTQYELLASASDELPSLGTVRNRLGRWSEVAPRLVDRPNSDTILRRAGVPEGVTGASRDEAVWLAHLAGDISERELAELLDRAMFRWHDSYGEPPDAR
jgi:hypothetical protein